MLRRILSILSILSMSGGLLAPAAEPSPIYHPAHPFKGDLTLVGSDSMDPLVRLWFEEFRKFHPDAQLSAISKGSGTAPKALQEGRSVIGPMSRPMTAAEEAAFEKEKGYKPTRVVVAHDALAIWVHRNNPLKSVSMEQLDAIYSKTRKAGLTKALTTWGALGLHGRWRKKAILPFGRDELSGSRAFFQEHVLLKAPFTDSYRVAGDQWAVVEAPGNDARGISYGPLNYTGALVRQVPVIPTDGCKAFTATPETILNGKYPLARTLNFYLDRGPGHPLPALASEFLSFVLSRQGQALVASYGSVEVPAEQVRSQRSQLEIP